MNQIEKLAEMIQEDLEGFAEADQEPTCELFVVAGGEVQHCGAE